MLDDGPGAAPCKGPCRHRIRFRRWLWRGPCPSARRRASYRLGWETGAIAARRVPVPGWMLAVVAQSENGCEASA